MHRPVAGLPFRQLQLCEYALDHLYVVSKMCSDRMVAAPQINEMRRLVPISYSSTAIIHWYLDDIRAQNPIEAELEIRQLPHLREGTNAGTALFKAYEVFSHEETVDSERYNDPHLIRLVIITSEGCSHSYNPELFIDSNHQIQAGLDALKRVPNVVIFAVGIGPNVCVNQLRHMAGCMPAESDEPCSRVMYVDFNQVSISMSKLVEAACKAGLEEGGQIGEKEKEEGTQGGEGGAGTQEGAEGAGGGGNSEPKGKEKKEGGNHGALIAGGKVVHTNFY